MKNNFFNSEQEDKIINAIKTAEKNTSGEIRVHIENRKNNPDPLSRAQRVFKILKMHKTENRNGVVFYLDTLNKKFAIYGDEGINKNVPENFWDDIKNNIIELFKKGEFAEGLSKGILMAGDALKKYFPYQKDDINELSDEISKGNI